MENILSGSFLVDEFQKGSVLNIEGQDMKVIDFEDQTESGEDYWGNPGLDHFIYVTEVDTGNLALNAMLNAALESGELRIEHYFEKEEYNEGDYCDE